MKLNTFFAAALASATSLVSAAALRKGSAFTNPAHISIERRDVTPNFLIIGCSLADKDKIHEALAKARPIIRWAFSVVEMDTQKHLVKTYFGKDDQKTIDLIHDVLFDVQYTLTYGGELEFGCAKPDEAKRWCVNPRVYHIRKETKVEFCPNWTSDTHLLPLEAEPGTDSKVYTLLWGVFHVKMRNLSQRFKSKHGNLEQYGTRINDPTKYAKMAIAMSMPKEKEVAIYGKGHVK